MVIYDRNMISSYHMNYTSQQTRYSPNAVLIMVHRLRRWPNIETALGEYPVFAGIWSSLDARMCYVES